MAALEYGQNIGPSISSKHYTVVDTTKSDLEFAPELLLCVKVLNAYSPCNYPPIVGR